MTITRAALIRAAAVAAGVIFIGVQIDHPHSDVGAVPVSLRAFVPEAALDLGLVTMAVGIGWISIWLCHHFSRVTTLAARSVTDVPLVGANH
jgi:hypothetical protein